MHAFQSIKAKYIWCIFMQKWNLQLCSVSCNLPDTTEMSTNELVYNVQPCVWSHTLQPTLLQTNTCPLLYIPISWGQKPAHAFYCIYLLHENRNQHLPSTVSTYFMRIETNTCPLLYLPTSWGQKPAHAFYCIYLLHEDRNQHLPSTVSPTSWGQKPTLTLYCIYLLHEDRNQHLPSTVYTYFMRTETNTCPLLYLPTSWEQKPTLALYYITYFMGTNTCPLLYLPTSWGQKLTRKIETILAASNVSSRT